jgi:hypothetical protein
VRSMTVLKGLLEAVVLIIAATAVAAVAAVLWIIVGDGSYISRLGFCLLLIGALLSVAGGLVLSQANSSDTFAWFGHGPERGDAGGGRVLTGIGIALFVGAPLIIAGAVLLT